MTKALITGASGQDAFYLSDLLLSKGYEVCGISRRTSQRKKHPNIEVIAGDVTDPSITETIIKARPDEIYHLAGQAYVWESFKVPQATFQINTFGTLNVLEAAKALGSKMFQASTSEMFGNSSSPQNEKTPFHPRSPYGVSKLAAHWLAINYREAYGLPIYCGIMFNHESSLRGHEFLSRKVCEGVADIVTGKKEVLILGNLSSRRDWGHAKDFVRGMWQLLQGTPRDIIFATGESHTAEEFVSKAFEYVGLDWQDYVVIDPTLFRPTEVNDLLGDPTEAKKMGWQPEYNLDSLIKEMMSNALSDRSKPLG